MLAFELETEDRKLEATFYGISLRRKSKSTRATLQDCRDHRDGVRHLSVGLYVDGQNPHAERNHARQ